MRARPCLPVAPTTRIYFDIVLDQLQNWQPSRSIAICMTSLRGKVVRSSLAVTSEWPQTARENPTSGIFTDSKRVELPSFVQP